MENCVKFFYTKCAVNSGILRQNCVLWQKLCRFTNLSQLRKNRAAQLGKFLVGLGTANTQSDWPWVFDKQLADEVCRCVTDFTEVFIIKRVAQSRDVRQCRQLVSSEEWRTTTQTDTDIQAHTHRHIQAEIQRVTFIFLSINHSHVQSMCNDLC